MFANLVQLITGRMPAPEIGRPVFVEAVRVPQPVVRHPRVVRLIVVCWVLITLKHVAIVWAVWHYHVPVHQLWVNFPTWLLGVLATCAYYGGTRRA
jgi:hypothetical protein